MNIELTLTPTLKRETVDELRVAFSDVSSALFEEVIPILHQAMEDFVALKFNLKNVVKLKLFADRYLPEDFPTDAAGKAKLEIIRLIVSACCVLMLSKHAQAKELHITPFHPEAYLERYLHINHALFEVTTETEEAQFVPFINFLRTALMVMPARLNKQLIINIACRLQTPQPLLYTWGKGMGSELRRFVAIYELETGERLKERPERAQKRSASSISSDSDDASHRSNDNDTEDDQAWQCRRTDVRTAGVPLNASADAFFRELQEPQGDLPIQTEPSQAQLEVSYSDQLLSLYTAPGGELVDFPVECQDRQLPTELPASFSDVMFGFKTDFLVSVPVSC